MTFAALALTLASNDIENLDVLYDGLSPAIVTISTDRFGEGPSIGTGVLVHEKGYIVTAGHVVEGSDSIAVHFLEGDSKAARIVTLSRTEDLALIKVDDVDAKIYIPELGDSDRLKVGQPVFMIGTPLGLHHTLTEGIISSLRETQANVLMMPHLPEKLIQTDAAMNQGNSGGAIFNADGQVVGIASFIASPSGGSVGLGFAVPSNAVRRRLFDQALPYIGVSLRRIPADLAALFNWPPDSLLIEHVDPTSAAAAAGLRGGAIEAQIGMLKLRLGGDLIVRVGDLEAGKAKEIHAYLRGLKAGESIRYVVARGGSAYEVSVPLAETFELPQLAKATRFGARALKKK